MAERNWGRMIFNSSESALHIPKEMEEYSVACVDRSSGRVRAALMTSQGR
jgi:hypothetical protein